MKRYVLDASALIVFFEDLPGAEKVEQVLQLAIENRAHLSLCVITWGEACYSICRARGNAIMRKVQADILQLPIELVEVGKEITSMAIELRGLYGLSYTDSFPAALTRLCKASLVTANHVFSQMAKETKIVWADAG